MKDWELTAVYASLLPHKRLAIWEKLMSIRRMDPWLLIGDFNFTLKEGERNTKGGALADFIKWTQEMALIDMGFIGQRYPWDNGR